MVFIMFKKIYIPIDSAESSIKVLIEGLKFAKSINAEVRVTHVINFEENFMGVELVGVADLKDTVSKVASQLELHIKDVLAKNGLNDIEIISIENHGQNLAKCIMNDALKFDTDLFVLHSEHLAAFSHFIKGGVVEMIANSCEIPILLVK